MCVLCVCTPAHRCAHALGGHSILMYDFKQNDTILYWESVSIELRVRFLRTSFAAVGNSFPKVSGDAQTKKEKGAERNWERKQVPQSQVSPQKQRSLTNFQGQVHGQALESEMKRMNTQDLGKIRSTHGESFIANPSSVDQERKDISLTFLNLTF